VVSRSLTRDQPKLGNIRFVQKCCKGKGSLIASGSIDGGARREPEVTTGPERLLAPHVTTQGWADHENGTCPGDPWDKGSGKSRTIKRGEKNGGVTSQNAGKKSPARQLTDNYTPILWIATGVYHGKGKRSSKRLQGEHEIQCTGGRVFQTKENSEKVRAVDRLETA